jgi:GxxExxY protein
MHPDKITEMTIKAAMDVHTALGPGLLEAVYENCLAYELRSNDLAVQQQVSLPVTYKQVRLELGYRLDLLVNEIVVVEIKAIEALTSVHKAQLLSYLRLSGKPVGLLINFNVVHLRDGIKRVVNGLDESKSSASIASSAFDFPKQTAQGRIEGLHRAREADEPVEL